MTRMIAAAKPAAKSEVDEIVAGWLAEVRSQNAGCTGTLKVSLQSGVVTHVRDCVENSVPVHMLKPANNDDVCECVKDTLARALRQEMFGEIEFMVLCHNGVLYGTRVRRERVSKLRTTSEARNLRAQ